MEVWADLSDYWDTDVGTTDDEGAYSEVEPEPERREIETVCLPPKGIFSFLLLHFFLLFCMLFPHYFIFRTLPMIYPKHHLTMPRAVSVIQHYHAR